MHQARFNLDAKLPIDFCSRYEVYFRASRERFKSVNRTCDNISLGIMFDFFFVWALLSLLAKTSFLKANSLDCIPELYANCCF